MKFFFLGLILCISNLALAYTPYLPPCGFTLDGNVTKAFAEAFGEDAHMYPNNAYSRIHGALFTGSFKNQEDYPYSIQLLGTTYANSFKYSVKDGISNISFKKINEKTEEKPSVDVVVYYRNGLPIEADIQIASKISDLKSETTLNTILEKISETAKNISTVLKANKISCIR